MKSRFAAWVMVVIVLIYLVVVFERAIVFISTTEPIAIALGCALLVLPIIGLWVLWREMLFGLRSQKLVLILRETAELPADEGTLHESEEAWQTWFCRGLAHENSGNRAAARSAIRTAIKLYRHAAQ